MRKIVDNLLGHAGIRIDGPNPWDIQVLDERFYARVLKEPILGLGESYMDGWWNCARIDQFVEHLMDADIESYLKKSPKDLFYLLLHKLFNFQTKAKATEVAKKHYNIGNVLYATMLGKSMSYSCAYWKYATTLDDAQRDKMELICQKLELKPGQRLLDIGCGWGSLAKYAAEHHGVEVVGLTISQPQKEYAEEICLGLPVTILLQDYRELKPDTFDRIVSVGMFEHVGYKNYDQFMKIVWDNLADDGIFLLHTIGGNTSNAAADPWITKYIFPNGMLPSVVQIGESIDTRFVMEDWHNFGVDYDRTLMAWYHNFNAHWPELRNSYDDRFKRMWDYYLLSCAGVFRGRKMQLWQIVLTKHGLKSGFQARELLSP